MMSFSRCQNYLTLENLDYPSQRATTLQHKASRSEEGHAMWADPRCVSTGGQTRIFHWYIYDYR